MASKDPHQGGDLFDMAAEGTSIPNDAGVMNIIPSKPRPGEAEGSVNASQNPLAAAASNPADIPRGVRDMGATGEVETGTGYVVLEAGLCTIEADLLLDFRDALPAQIESKRLHYSANNPLAKGHDRYDKHTRQKESDFERYAGEGPGVDLQPSEDKLAGSSDVPDEEVDRIVDSREQKQT